MKRRMIQAAALAGCSAVHADPTVPGGTGPQHLRPDGSGGRRGRVGRETRRRSDGFGGGRRRLPRNEAAPWWHSNKSSENDVGYTHVGSLTLGGGGGTGVMQANSAAAAAAEEEKEEDDSGRGSFAVHALYNHGPGPSDSGDSGGSGGDMVANSSPASGAMSNGSGSAASWLVYFPVWDEGVEGGRCGSSPDYAHLPSSYIDLDEYMFRSRGECCDRWFGRDEADLAMCYGREEDGTETEEGGTVAPGSGTEVDADVTLSLEDIFGDDDDEAGGSAGEDVLGMSAAVGGPAPTDEPTDAPTYEPTAAPSDAPTDVPTAAPTDTPTHEPTLSPAEPGPYHTSSPQNYCGRPGLVQDDCANPAIGTCNDGDGRCPDGFFCFGNILCAARIPSEPTDSPTFSPTGVPTSSPLEPTESPSGEPTASPSVPPDPFLRLYDALPERARGEVVYSQTFDTSLSGERGLFTWGSGGNGARWRLESSDDGQSYACVPPGGGRYRTESNVELIVDGAAISTGAEQAVRDKLVRGGYLSFAVNVTGLSYSDLHRLELLVDGVSLMRWNDETDGWDHRSLYVPPMLVEPDEAHVFVWRYTYFGSDRDGDDEDSVKIQLDSVRLEAYTSDLRIDNDVLRTMEYSGDGVVAVPELTLNHPAGDAAWEVVETDGTYSLLASTRDAIVGAGSVHTDYRGSATMSLTVLTGPWGGKFGLSLLPRVQAPVDVFEVAIDGMAVAAATTPSANWSEMDFDLSAGRHVVTFRQVSNPSGLSPGALHRMGQPGSTKVAGVWYASNIDPSLLTSEPSAGPTGPPTASPTVYTIPPQAYCGDSLGEIESLCWTDEARTCNPGDPPCPSGQSCWGNVPCVVPVGMSAPGADDDGTPAPSPFDGGEGSAPAAAVGLNVAPASTPQNYCGKSRDVVLATCSSGTIPTCNEGEVCPLGTYCFGYVSCPPPPCPGGEVAYTVQVLTDDYPEESSYKLVNLCTGTVEAEKSFVDEVALSTTELRHCVPPGEYRFEFHDSYGDGFQGAYVATADGEEGAGGVTVASGPATAFSNTGSEEITTFGECPVTDEPTGAPGSGPANYCAASRAKATEDCSTLPTCGEEGDEPCPRGTFCWGNIQCETEAVQFSFTVVKAESSNDETAVPTSSPSYSPTLALVDDDDGGSWSTGPQNYCGTSKDDILANCRSGTVPTCNYAPCAPGTFCFAAIECPAPSGMGMGMHSAAVAEPTDPPAEEEEEEEDDEPKSFLDFFFGGQQQSSSEDVETPSPQAVVPEFNHVSSSTEDCPDGTSPAHALPGCCVPDPSFLGDGACDAEGAYNTAACGYDLGDCCHESCDRTSYFGCDLKAEDDVEGYGPFGFYCLDPAYSHIDETRCRAERRWIGDGGCDPDFNTPECGWDGGDCCRQTCDDEMGYFECGVGSGNQEYDCRNPDIIYRADYVP